MKLQIYNSSILVHYKCGTRFLDKQFNITEESNKNRFSLDELSQNQNSIKYIVIRDPLDHLISAIYTELSETDSLNLHMESILKKMISNTNDVFRQQVRGILCASASLR